MTPGFWMHESCLDACIEVMRVQYRDHKRVKLRGRWWVLGYTGNPWCVYPQASTIEIARKDLLKWKNINSAIASVRTKPGVPDGI